ncbi:hypothetical protein ACNOYE_11430 [Nannocystaceae bacterium ST9]
MTLESEAAYRSAISRYYYSIFNIANEILTIHCPTLAGSRGKDSHQATWDAVESLRHPKARSLATRGRSMRAKRTEADYRGQVRGDWRARAQLVQSEAKACARTLRELLETPAGRL